MTARKLATTTNGAKNELLPYIKVVKEKNPTVPKNVDE